MSALLLNLVACQSLWSVPSRCSLSLVESILRDPGAVSLTGRKGTENVFKHFRRAWKLTENFRRAFSPGPTDCPWVSEDASRMTICASSACSKQLPVFLIFHSEVMGRNNGKWVPIFMQLSPGSEKSGSPTPWRSGYHFYLRLVDVKHDSDKFAAYFYHLILLLKSIKLFPQLLRGVQYVSITLLNISTPKSV